jgi:hypothetical protein
MQPSAARRNENTHELDAERMTMHAASFLANLRDSELNKICGYAGLTRL